MALLLARRGVQRRGAAPGREPVPVDEAADVTDVGQQSGRVEETDAGTGHLGNPNVRRCELSPDRIRVPQGAESGRITPADRAAAGAAGEGLGWRASTGNAVWVR